MTTKLKSISDIRNFFRNNEKPMFFISPTNFNLIGINEWVKNFNYIYYIDSYNGNHPSGFAPIEDQNSQFNSIENYRSGQREVVDYNNYLLSNSQVIDYIKSFGKNPVALFLMFDENTEKLCQENNIKIWFPPNSLRQRLDNKIETVRLGNLVGVKSVPNCISQVNNYTYLQELAETYNLGTNLVIQTAFGDSGHGTFFITNETDWNKYANLITKQSEVKIMKQINCYSATQESCITKQGIIIAPLQTEVIGFSELTSDKGGWCGNELFPNAFTQEIKDKAWEYTFKFGKQLEKEGYRGYFNLDYLIEISSGEVFLGELNPRISGATPLTNHAAFANSDVPLFLFHLLEFSDIDFELNIDEINQKWSNPANIDTWSSLIIKHIPNTIETVKSAPPTGIWCMNNDGSIKYSHFDCSCRNLKVQQEAFVQTVAGVGNYRYHGGDLVRLILRDRVMTDDFQGGDGTTALRDRTQAWIKGILAYYS